MLNTPQPWEWGDQGRSEYTHNFSNFVGIARGLVLHAGGAVYDKPDPLRPSLVLATGLPFKPETYDIWRNYGRIFRSLLLATTNPWDSLQVTDVCRHLASPNPATSAWTVDDFLKFLAPRYYQPSPGRGGYTPNGPRVFPICALLRYLAAHLTITWEQTFDLLIGNGVEGNENREVFEALISSGYNWTDSQKRQVREFMAFVAQFSFLTWDGNTLEIAPTIANDEEFRQLLFDIGTPISQGFHQDQNAEVMRLGAMPAAPLPESPTVPPPVPPDVAEREFREGTPKAASHLVRERDPALREAYFANLAGVASCDVCGMVSSLRYPWTNAPNDSSKSLLEVHHVLPLASKAHKGKTKLEDLVCLCPSCHKAVHRYYIRWFKRNGLTDFADRAMARSVYDRAKAKYRP